jgi:ABC-type glycerol-3-phosphate transport system substrate-binding protein
MRGKMPLLRVLLAFALLCPLTACQAGIIGGADGPTSIFVTKGDDSDAIVIGPDGEVTSPSDADEGDSDAPESVDGASEAADGTDGASEAADGTGAASEAADGADAAESAAQASGPDGIPPTPEAPPTPLTLALLSGAWAEAIKAELPAFEEGNHAACTVLELSRDELHDLLAQGAGGVDLIMAHSSHMPEFRRLGALANLSALGYKSDADMVPNVMEICTDGNAVTLAPWYANASVLLCNKQSLTASGSSTDRLQHLDNMLAACKAAKQRGEIGFAYHESFEERIELDFLPVLRSFDGWILDHEGKPSIYTKKFQDAVNFFLELTATGKALPDGEFVSAIDGGKALMGFIRSDWYPLTAKSAATYIPFPGAAKRGGEAHDAGTCTLWGFGVPADSQSPELAERLLEYLLNPNIQRNMLPSGLTPCRYSILQDPEIQKTYPAFGKICAALENSRYVPAEEEWPQMCDILGEELWKVMAGRKKVTECLEDAQSRIEALLTAS